MTEKPVWQCRRCDTVYQEHPLTCNECKSKIFMIIEYYDGSDKHNPIRVLRDRVLALLVRQNKDEATELLTQYLNKETRFYATRFDERNEIYYYDEGIYKPNGRSFIKEFCRAVLKETYTEQLANRVAAKIEAENYIEQDQLLKRHYPNKIAVENGILDLQTRELTEFTPEMIFLAKIPIKYISGIECPVIRKFLQTTLNDANDVKTMEEWFGYCLFGGYPIQKIGLFIGGGGNGKGQTLELLRSFIGEKNYSGIPLQKLQESDFKEVELFNKLANIGADISDQPLKETSKIKGLSGGDSISASVKFKNDLVFINEAKLIFSANKLPKTYDLTEGFFRRWVYIVFPFKFLTQEEYEAEPEERKKNCRLKQDDIIKKIITPEELTGLLNLALDGLSRLLKNGKFTASKTSEETMQWWIRNSDSFLAFCWENLEENEDGQILKEGIRAAYGRFCRKNKLAAEGDKHIHEIMIREIKAWDYQDTETGARYWKGIKFKEDKIMAKTEKKEEQKTIGSVDVEIQQY